MLIASYGLLAVQGDLRFSIPLLIGITAFQMFIISIALFFSEKEDLSWPPFIIIAIAMIVRCFFLFRPPELSDDIYRYLWDGLQILQGTNPYAFAPSEIGPFDDISSDALKKMNHPDLVTIYPPAAQLVFMVGAFVMKSVLGLKTLLLLLDLGACAVIMKVLSGLKMPLSRGVLYAWHPLPVLEIASSGHIDGVGILFVLLSILFLQLSMQAPKTIFLGKEHGFAVLSGILLGGAAMVKLYPFFLTPAILVIAGRGRRVLFSIGLLLSCVLFTIPFLPELLNIFHTLGIYLRNWEFSNGSFRMLRNLTASGDASRLILLILFLGIALLSSFFLWRNSTKINEHDRSWHMPVIRNVSDSLASQNLVIQFIRSVYGITLAFLFLNPTLYPWYVLSLACLLPFVSGPAGIIFSWSVFLSYYILIDYAYLGQWVENSKVPILILCGPAVSALMNAYLKCQSRAKRNVILGR